jgi:glucose-1-phosphate cytidylyltransferase
MSESFQPVPVIVLCGGQGTRMRGDTMVKKELIELGGRPILWHVMKIYASYGHTRFVLALGYQADAVKRYFLEYQPMSYDFTMRLGHPAGIASHQPDSREDWVVTLVDTGLDSEKGARVRRAAQYIDADTFFVTYGEALGDVDVNALLSFHRRHGRLATVTGTRLRSHLGVFELDDTARVTGFREKPELDQWVNAGFMVFQRGVLSYLDDGDGVHLEAEVLPQLAASGELMMYRHTGYWRSMKTFKDAVELDRAWRQAAPWKVW